MYYSWHIYYLSLVCLFIINLCFIIDNDVVILLIRSLGKVVLGPFADPWFSSSFLESQLWVIFLPILWIGDTEDRGGQALFNLSSCLWDVSHRSWWDWLETSLGSMSWVDKRAKGTDSWKVLMLDLLIVSIWTSDLLLVSGSFAQVHTGFWSCLCFLLYTMAALCYVCAPKLTQTFVCSPNPISFSSGHSAKLHFPASLAVWGDHVTKSWQGSNASTTGPEKPPRSFSLCFSCLGGEGTEDLEAGKPHDWKDLGTWMISSHSPWWTVTGRRNKLLLC